MPADIQDKLFNLDDPEQIMRLQTQWNEYVAANEKYELSYPQQFANIVEGNRTFGQNKTIPTPAEQMAQYKQSILDEIDAIASEKNLDEKEEEYYIEEPNDSGDKGKGQSKGFDMNWEDVGRNLEEYHLSEQELAEPGKDNSQFKEMSMDWVQEYYADQKAMDKRIEAELEQDKEALEAENKSAEFKLDFGMNRDDMEQEMEQEREMEDLDMQYE